MIDYLLLIRNQGDPMGDSTDQDRAVHLGEWQSWLGGLATAGRLEGGQPLAEGAACVRQGLVTDGPYAEAKDVVGGYVIVACASLEHAIETAKACPALSVGSMVEVREIAPLPT